MRHLFWLIGGALLLVPCLTGCSVEFGPDFHYRIVVEVETPQGVRSGHAVRAVSCSGMEITGTGGPTWGCHTVGEAVAVDLPGGRVLFALLRGNDEAYVNHADYVAFSPGEAAFDPDFPTASNADNTYEEQRQRIQRRQLDYIRVPRAVPRMARSSPGMRDNFPMLVTFRNIDDPASVARVDAGDLAATFGPGVRLRRITVQVTDDDVTTGIERRLGWLNHLERYRADSSNPFTSTLPSEIGSLRSDL